MRKWTEITRVMAIWHVYKEVGLTRKGTTEEFSGVQNKGAVDLAHKVRDAVMNRLEDI